MTWTVRIFRAQDSRGVTVYDVVAARDDAGQGENPDHFVGCYPERFKAMAAGRLLHRRQPVKPPGEQVVPLRRQGPA